MRPDNAEFGITIDFEKGVSDPVKVFFAMAELLAATKEIDRLLFGAIDPALRPDMILEDVEAASITSWVRNKVVAIDDQALKQFDIKQQVGKYAVKAKYKILEYLDEKVSEEERERLRVLREDIYQLAAEERVRHLPLPDRITLADLVKPMDKIQDAKKLLGVGDQVKFLSPGESHTLDLGVRKHPSAFIGEEKADSSRGVMEMTLLVRKPDYLGDTQWEFRHGKNTISGHVQDSEWLERFRRGEIPLVPGTALACSVSYEYDYGEGGNLLSQKHEVVKVHHAIPPPAGTQSTFLE